ncbi:MAG TPA: bifunctional YncE family protein/alkaline phosphatase family protein [Terriglobales bacterium]|nr:bifunctional YncE family protein/alkaline phosphatase family protein [Terriglobales bacterium]
MKKTSLALAIALSCAVIVISSRAADQRSRVINLPTGKNLTLPVPGFIARTNSYPATIAISPDGRFAALLNQGYGTVESAERQSIGILDLTTNQLRDFPDDRLTADTSSTRQSYFIGLAFSTDGAHLYASMGSITDPAGEKPTSTGNGIAIYKFVEGQVTPERFIKIPPQHMVTGKEIAYGIYKAHERTAPPYPAGFAVLPGDSGDRLLIANNLSDNVVLLDVASGQVLKSFDVSRNIALPSAYPYTVVADKAGRKAWVSLWNASAVVELDVAESKILRFIDLWKAGNATAPGTHPTAMALSSAGDILYVALSNHVNVVAIDVASGKIARNYNTRLLGSAPIALAVSEAGNRLFVACANQDAVAVFDLKQEGTPANLWATPLGFIPTEWYPSALALTGNDLLIAAAKGEGSGPNNMQASVKTELHPNVHPYIATLVHGSIQRLSVTDIERNLRNYTRQYEDDNLLQSKSEIIGTTGDGKTMARVVFPAVGKFQFVNGSNPIKHVLYILKENRTYDQILGDLTYNGQAIGDGDPSLTMYGADITPNYHKLALQFGVLDNFYDSGEVSGDGHEWSDASITSDYNEKMWPIAYRGKERTYDFSGAVADEYPLEQGIPDIDDPGTGFLWDNLALHKFTYRIYGEMMAIVWCKSERVGSPKEGTPSPVSGKCQSEEIKKGEELPWNVGNPHGGPSPWPWPVPRLKSVRATKEAQRGHFDPLYPDFEVDYPDQLRADEFLREFDTFVKARGSQGELPQFVLLYLPDDHTGGTRPRKPTPQASVADNDLALGRVVDAVSHSAYWDDTAIFVVEDDAQNGADHVDAHRSIALEISKYAPRAEKPVVDHNFYSTVSMVHTMEALIGLPTMNLFDVHAPLMAPLLAGPGTQPPYQADDVNLRNGLIYRVNPKKAPGADESLRMDFSRPDAVDTEELNAILWQDAKGSAKSAP